MKGLAWQQKRKPNWCGRSGVRSSDAVDGRTPHQTPGWNLLWLVLLVVLFGNFTCETKGFCSCQTLKTADSGSNTVVFLVLFSCRLQISAVEFDVTDSIWAFLMLQTVKLVWVEGRGVRLDIVDSRRQRPQVWDAVVSVAPRSNPAVFDVNPRPSGAKSQTVWSEADPDQAVGVGGVCPSGGVSVRVNMSTCPSVSPSENTHHFIPV